MQTLASHLPKNGKNVDLLLVAENESTIMLWDCGITIGRNIQAQTPGVIVKDPKITCLLVDMAVPTDRNVSAVEIKKLSHAKTYILKDNVAT